VEAKLDVEAQSLEVLVTAERASGEAEAVNRELVADNIVQVLPAEVIRSLPNANMADALGRLPSVTIERDEGEGKYVQIRGTEPRLANLTIDGVNTPSPESGVRQIKLDAIPADIVESVEINKTLQANMDPDGIGGSVNLVTKTAGERPTRRSHRQTPRPNPWHSLRRRRPRVPGWQQRKFHLLRQDLGPRKIAHPAGPGQSRVSCRWCDTVFRLLRSSRG
jgi:outer membrane cobalamin receptor